MNILVLSDLHIDTHKSFGTFHWREKDLISQIDYIRHLYSIDKVIFNGDTFELYNYNYKQIKKANPLLIDYLKNENFIFIKGNHDLTIDFAINEYEIINSHGQTIHIEHGHKADWLNGTIVGRTLAKIGLYLIKNTSRFKIFLNLYLKFIDISDQINCIPKKYNTLKYLSYAIKLLKNHDIVILGHTHKLEELHTYYLHKKKRYLNSGTCSMGRFQAIVMDTETLKYELIKESKDSINKQIEDKRKVQKLYKNKNYSKK